MVMVGVVLGIVASKIPIGSLVRRTTGHNSNNMFPRHFSVHNPCKVMTCAGRFVKPCRPLLCSDHCPTSIILPGGCIVLHLSFLQSYSIPLPGLDTNNFLFHRDLANCVALPNLRRHGHGTNDIRLDGCSEAPNSFVSACLCMVMVLSTSCLVVASGLPPLFGVHFLCVVAFCFVVACTLS